MSPPAVGPSPRRVGALEVAALMLVLVAFVVAVVVLIRVPIIFGHDESVYALQIRGWLGDGPVAGIGPHRAPLLSVLGIPAYLVTGGSEVGFRLVGLVSGVAALLGLWVLGRRIAGPVAGVGAAAIVASSPPVLEAAARFLTDLPAVAAMIWVIVALHADLEGRARRDEPPGPGLVAAAVLAAAALYLRYGSALPIALIGATALALWWPQVRDHAGRVAGAAGLFLLLLVPHFVRSTREFGVPWGRVTHTGEVAAAPGLGEGLAGYADMLPAELAGWPVAIAIVAGLLGLLVHAGRSAVAGRLDARTRGLVLLVVPGLAHTVAMGLVAPPVTRFIFFGVVLLATAGAVAAADVADLVTRRVRPVVAAELCLVALLGLGWLGADATRDLREHHAGLGEWHEVLAQASAVLREDADAPCGVISSYVPPINWYGGCQTYEFSGAHLVDHERRYLLLIAGGKRQPEGEALEAFLSCVEEEPIAEFRRRPGLAGEGDLYRFRDDPPETCPAP